MATNQKFINMMVNQPNNALMRKYTHLGVSLLLWHHTEIGEIAGSSAKALEELIDLQRNKSALRAAGIVCDPEREKKLKQQAAEVQEKLIPYYLLATLFGHVQGLQRPEEEELASFKESLHHQVSFDIEGTPWEDEYDLFHVFPKKSEPLDRLSESLTRKIHKCRTSPRLRAFLKWLPRRIIQHLILPGHELGDDMEQAIPLVIKPEALKRIIFRVAIFLAPCITVLPMFVLYAISSIWVRIAAVWGFSQAFVSAVSFLTNDSNTSFIFSTNAAFCAVLAVFVGSAPS